jgi:hypothetical protein
MGERLLRVHQTGARSNTVRMIRYFATLSDEQIDVGFIEFALVHQFHFRRHRFA